MSFFQRVATFATMTLGIAALTGASTPGFASQLDPSLNALAREQVPENSSEISSAGVIAPATSVAPTDEVVQSIVPVPQPDDAVEFTTLSQAVAAQAATDAGNRDISCLAGAIYFEAKGEPLSGQLAVAEVILNRAKSGRFATSVCGVVTQAGQFSFVRGGHVPVIADNADYRTAIAVAQVAMGDHWDSPAANALYFHARRVAPGWRMTKVAAIGNHVFYR